MAKTRKSNQKLSPLTITLAVILSTIVSVALCVALSLMMENFDNNTANGNVSTQDWIFLAAILFLAFGPIFISAAIIGLVLHKKRR